MRDFMIIAAEGVFHVPEGGAAPVAYPDGEDPVPILESLEAMLDREVIVSLHHFPPDPPDPTSQGFGSCLMGPHCPVGHVDRPTWMLDFRASGNLRREGFAWFVGDERIPLASLPGHRGRFVMATSDAEIEAIEGATEPPEDVQDILNEAAELETLLRGLRDVVKEVQ